MAARIEPPRLQYVDVNGNPYPGGKLYVYNVGTTTARSIYSDEALSNAAANPIIADANGTFSQTYTATGAYKLVFKNSDDVEIWTEDNIDTGVPAGTGALPVASGGTGATTAAGARTNLSVPSASEMATAQVDIAALQTRVGTTTGAGVLSKGTTAQRPASPTVGNTRYNTDTSEYEAYRSTAAWSDYVFEDDAATQAEQETGSATDKFVSPGRQHYHQSAAKAWAKITYTAGVPALTTGYNFTNTVSDDGTGLFTVNFTTALSSANYAVLVTPLFGTAASHYFAYVVSQSTTQIQVQVETALGGGTATDPNGCFILVFGDI